MEEEQQQNEGISIGEIFAMIGKRIFWILGIAVVVALIVGLLTKFVLSPMNEEYQITFILDYPNMTDSNGKLVYPDGTEFNYKTIVYSDNLNAVRDSDDSFAAIKTEKMASNQNIRIEEQTQTVGSSVQRLGIYTITVASSYFKNVDQATEYLHALCNYAIDSVIQKVEGRNFESNLSSYDKVGTYSEQITSLEKQYDYLLAQYDSYITLYEDYSYEGKSLGTYRAEVESMFVSGGVKLTTLKNDLEINRYIHPSQTVNEIKTQIAALELEKTTNETKRAALEKQLAALLNLHGEISSSEFNTFEAFHSKIAEYVVLNANIDVEIALLYRSIGYEKNPDGTYTETGNGVIDSTEFKQNLKTVYELIKQESELCRNVIVSLYHDNSSCVFEQYDAVETGGMSTILFTIIGFVAAFVLASFVFCLVDYNRKKKADSRALQAETKEETVAEQQPEQK